MKRLAMLFIFLIGMISQTSMATTPLMEQKQKTTISEPVMQVVNVANVDDAVFTCDAVFFVNGNLQFKLDLLKTQGLETAIIAVNQYLLNGTTNQKAIVKCLIKRKIRLASGDALSVTACVDVDGQSIWVSGLYSLNGDPMLEPVASYVDSCKC